MPDPGPEFAQIPGHLAGVALGGEVGASGGGILAKMKA